MKILQWGIYLIVFCLPLYLIRFKVFSVPTTVLELMIYVLFVFWLFKVRYGEIKDTVIKTQEIILPIIFILVGVSAATIFSWDPRTSLGIWKAWFVDPILFFIVAVSIIKNIEQVKKVFYSLIFSGFVISLISLIYLFLGKLDAQGRLEGIYTSPNYLAMYLAPILIIGLGLLFLGKDYSLKRSFVALPAGRQAEGTVGAEGDRVKARRSAAPRWGVDACLWAINLFLVVVLILTKSFGAWLGILAALVFGLIVYLSKTKNKKIIFGIIFTGLAIVLVFAFLKTNSIQGRLSLGSRLEIWQKALQVFKTYPVFGIGPGTFEAYFPLYPKWGVPQPHNLYLALLLQTGILGFIGFIWLLLWFFRAGFKIYNLKFIIIAMSVMVYMFVHGLVDTTYWKNDLAMLFWLFIGLMAGFKKEPQ